MILVRAPLRISFVGGGTDLPDFYTRYPGRVISGAINKYIYVLVNPTPLLDKITAKYSKTEEVSHPSELEHTRIKAALLDMGIVGKGIEIGSFADLPARTGLGSSSTFSVALLKALHTYLDKKLTKQEAAEAASRLEIELLGEPIGKQDQYAASYGGLNVIQFNQDHSVDVSPVLLDYKTQGELEDSMVLVYTGLTRDASSVLSKQKQNIESKLETMKAMADSVPEFHVRLKKGDIKGMGEMLHEGWLRKKSLTNSTSNNVLDELYEEGMNFESHGGKLLGAGGGGCLLFLAPKDKKAKLKEAVLAKAKLLGLDGAKEIPTRFVHSGCDVLVHHIKEI